MSNVAVAIAVRESRRKPSWQQQPPVARERRGSVVAGRNRLGIFNTKSTLRQRNSEDELNQAGRLGYGRYPLGHYRNRIGARQLTAVHRSDDRISLSVGEKL